jgi:hypothetical protein
MWRHQVGRVDFEKPLFQLMQRGWDFRERTPIGGAQDGGFWAVIGVNDAQRVQVDGSERNEAWAEAVRLAFIAPIERRTRRTAPFSSEMRGSPDDPTVCDEERARLTQAGWCFTEHLTAQASGREGWVVSGMRGGRRVRAVDDERVDAWGSALILAAVSGTATSGGPTEPRTRDCAE